MNKAEYLRRLEAGLKRLPVSERQDLLNDFAEHFATGVESGHSEEEICRRLGAPEVVVKEMIAEYRIVEAEHGISFLRMLRAVSATTRLGIGALLGMFPVLAGITLYGVACFLPAVFLLSPLLLLWTMPFYDRTDGMLYASLSLIFFSLGLLGGIGLYAAGKRMAAWAIQSTKSQYQRVKGETQ
ncbi:DUF1700 domain-containing protein [Paenibacillus cellulositrophicus]|uniref:DUF1700 domain-containing protein n=1 Tax=Paenibacillus cellulositrophicus TaxID=562959 RepID=UPI001267119B|nr:DUF1700 domain-containing protein [Paenibacillus cellulositrophicus]